MRICTWHLLSTTLTLLWPDILRADTIGFDVVARSNQLAQGRGIFVLFDIKFAAGYVTSFSAYFNEPANAFKFQIWRPVEPFMDTETLTLVAEIDARNSPLEKYVIEPLNPIRVEDGDRLGFLYAGEGSSPLAATMTSTTTNMYYTTSTLSPDIQQSIRFNILQYPVEFSISADYTIDTTYMGEGPLISGPSGATGETGPSGIIGPKGEKGAIGPAGITGVRGTKGDKGEAGLPGYYGSDGATGSLGPSGATGQRGETGATGQPGPKGNKGMFGPLGSPGGPGAQGSTGATGATGSPGATGSSGYYGPPGSPGATGATGGIGATGGAGIRGLQGPRGDEGPPGPPGSSGPPGEQGQKGDRGPLYQDHDECSSDTTHGCQHTCVNQFGSYTCECDEGYIIQADGHTCKDFDECTLHNGGCQSVCMNTAGSYSCSCPAGTSLGPDGQHCTDIRECQVDRGGCEDEELCVDTYGEHYCMFNVPTMYIGDGGRPTKETNKDANLVIGSSGASNFNVEDAELLNRNMMIGIIVWLILLSLIILTILLCLCIRKIQEHNDTPGYAQQLDARSRTRAESVVYNKDGNYY